MKKPLSLEDLSLESKNVLVRVDFNVPLTKEGKVLDNSRILAALPTIKYLLSKQCRVILMSHLGRPKGGFSKELSLKPAAEELSSLLKKPVLLAPDCIGDKVMEMAGHLKPGEILLLENLRFNEAEEHPEKDPSFAKKLASLGDFYIDDAFGCAHRAHASIVDVAKYFPKKAAAGYLLQKEIAFLGDALKNPKRPFLALIGGAKISSKIGVLTKLISGVDRLCIGGAMAFTFLKAQGIKIGDSLVEDDFLTKASDILKTCKKPLLLPVDIVAAKENQVQIFSVTEGIPNGFKGVDIGPKTIDLFSQEIKKAKTILWNGPMGIFENPAFAIGTHKIAEVFAKADATTIAGGGETVAAINELQLGTSVSHLSTGGGASLEYLELGTLPGIDVLISS